MGRNTRLKYASATTTAAAASATVALSVLLFLALSGMAQAPEVAAANIGNTTTASTATAVPPTADVLGDLKITGPAADQCRPAITNAFAQIQKSPYYYQLVDRYLVGINCVETSPLPAQPQGYVTVRNATFMAPAQTYHDSSTTWLASDIVHETCHIKQYKQYDRYGGYDAEMECNSYQLAFLTAIDAPQSEINWLKYIINTSRVEDWTAWGGW